jgi:hypothetical protein
MIKRVLKGIRELLRRGVDVAIAKDEQKSSSKETRKAKTMARQKGSKACRSLRQVQHDVLTAIGTARDQTGFGAT